MNEQEKKVILSLKNVVVKFNVRGRILTAIRNVSLDIYDGESIAIVGESGSGKSVLTKTFAGMLDSNGFIPEGSVVFSDDDLSKTDVKMTGRNRMTFQYVKGWLDKYSRLERGAAEYQVFLQKKQEIRRAYALSEEEEAEFAARMKEKDDDIVDRTNYFWTLDKKTDAAEYEKTSKRIAELKKEKAAIEAEKKKRIAEKKKNGAQTFAEDVVDYDDMIASYDARREKIAIPDVEPTKENPYGLTEQKLARNERIAYEVLLSIGRYPFYKQLSFLAKLRRAFKRAMSIGLDLENTEILNKVFEAVVFRVEYRSYDEENKILHGYAIIDCAKIKFTNDWQQIRGRRIATVFQDPMTSLNPVLTIGKQIVTVILKHQKCSKAEAKRRAIDIMGKVGIPDPEKRFNDYPFEYSGGMRQRIVIAIALSCQPKILICDEPTTALDVTIQAQILRLIKSLQKELGFTTVYITHDLGVVANVAERVAVLYGGQIVELGTVEDIFYDPKHPYTWALLSSLPQLCERGSDLFSIPGTPPSLYNKIVGDAFAMRSQYAMAIDFVEEPPMFRVSDTHWAKTWLLDPRAPKVEKPENICNLHEKISRTYVDFSDMVKEEEEAGS
ncbi:MAG: ATP-binding cassette domain-containing protein [Ruminococcaceae bacterium]|nr:ATP-binding cassette domain-containing protein [Oscillospiraceae bacterium]